MSLQFRRFLYIAFIIAFLVITPQVILKAKGYRLKFSKNLKEVVRLQKTGILVLDSNPESAKIYLNGTLQQKALNKYFSLILPADYKERNYLTTPTKIKDLFPGEYTVKLQKEGYWDWEKKLKINEGQSTFAEDIYLFKNALPQIAVKTRADALSPSPDQKFIALINEDEISLINLDGEEKISLGKASSTNPANILWSPDSKKILVNTKIYSLDERKFLIDLKNNATFFRWDNGENKKIFYLTTVKEENYINSFDLDIKTSSPLIKDGKINDFLVAKDNIFFINESGQTDDLNVYDKNGKLIRIIGLPFLSNYQFINPEHNLINILDKKHSSLYLVDPTSYLPFVDKIENIKYSRWIGNEKMLYANDFEIYLYNLSSKEKILLTRISSPLKAVFWHPSNNYVIYATANSLNTIELDKREKRNITELIKLNIISSPFLDAKGDLIYFYSQIGNQEGIFKLGL